ncbi:MAG: TetR/AcrR family transcriptional regulator [Ectothiorhodospiraceae bacterium]|nr:TetR/AcrR family transcriptional regulator [Ectothiorhodospiraceae bacterium]MCH8504423.1 TetR/AcrR family transcriptional regulator [Ectothiorhodospiraceae bacterium]
MQPTADAIVDAALTVAEEASWERLRLYQVAQALEADLNAVRRHFREKEELADAWFDRADAAMLACGSEPAVKELPTVERLETLIWAWLDRLEPHRRVTRQMIRGKLEPGHLHVQIPAVLRISRTVQWLREAAGRDAPGVYRGLEETVLTSLFVATFLSWLRDDSPGFRRTRGRLHRGLRGARLLSGLVPGYRTAHHDGSLRLPAPVATPEQTSADGNRQHTATE